MNVHEAATDPGARNGEFYGPRWIARGAPVRLRPDKKRARPEDTRRVWSLSESLTGTVFSLGH